jgi:predicted NBD/HSP70 family sugar kinase
MRRLNARRVLEFAWVSEAFTASDVMTSTGLTRSTVIGVCDQLVGSGWLLELGDARAVGDYRKGRPARRYSLRDEAAVVVGLEAGFDRMSATVADLRGRVLGRAEGALPARDVPGHAADIRLALARRVVDDAITSALVAPDGVLALTVGVPAPVSLGGASPGQGTDFWQLMNPGYRQLFAASAPIVTVENDANLAAIAERASTDGRGHQLDSFIALLVGEGIGAGLMIDSRLVRGRRGGAGEMRFLDHVSGVGSADGLALCARRWAAEAIHSRALPEHSMLARLDPAAVHERDVTRAAEAGDAAAAAILDRLAARLAQICLVLGALLDVDRIIVGGSVVDSLPGVLRRAATILAATGDPASPELVASALGADAVTTGAVEHALARVLEQVFELTPGVVRTQ